MGLTPGTRLGAYEVTAQLGVGGMGEVYRATDTTLSRQVAIKILPDAFASDPERMARFEREAKTLASLNHPNIAALYHIGDAPNLQSQVPNPSTIKYLVMELVEGEDLSALIARQGHLTPEAPDDALSIAKQIAEALEAAHEQGIIHRDLKPANIKVRADGTVKVLDFGLAKAIEPASALRASAGQALSQSPTLTSPAMMTGVGVILGTAAYMSPEQAKGREADKRSDVWAFGCVLYEMLTGTRAFDGEDMTEVLGAVVRLEPDWEALSSNVPLPVRALLQSCLVKDRRRRVADISTALFVLDKVASLAAPVGTGSVALLPRPPLWRRALPWTVATGALVTTAAVLVLWAPWQKAAPQVPIRLSAELGADVTLVQQAGGTTSLSPDGQVMAVVAPKAGGIGAAGNVQIYIRRLDELKAVPLSGTDGASGPLFSPDGQWVAFNAGGKLKRVSVSGGAAITVADAPGLRGGTWSEDGTITFSPQNGAGLVRVSSAGGTPEPLTTLGEGQATHRWPQMLPGGNAVLFTAHTGVTGFDEANLEVQPLPTGARKVVQRGAYYGRYLPSGHLVYIHGGTLFAAPFDLDRMELTSPPVPVLEGVMTQSGGAAHVAVSNNGTLVYRPRRSGGADAPIEWMDREGTVTPLRATAADWSNLVFAPDGRRLALDISDGQQTDVWTYEWERDSLARLTSGPGNAQQPVWTPDGRRIVFGSTRGDTAAMNLYWQRADGTGEVQRLTTSRNFQGAWSWHPNGRLLAFQENSDQRRDDVLILPIEGDEASGWKPGTPTVFLNGPSAERAPMFSPDGRWLAYQSTESGQDEVYVRPFPGPGSRWKISTGGGTSPTWSRARRELFFGAPDGRIMVSAYTAGGDVFHPEKPVPWSESRFMEFRRVGPIRSFDLHPDGNRFALAKLGETQRDAKQDTLVFIFNFFDELRRVAPVTKR